MIIDQRDPRSGRRNRQVVGTFPTKKAAEKAERQALEARDGGTLVEPDKLTVSELLDRWLRTKRDEIRPQTYALYERTINNHLAPALGTVPVQKVTAAGIEDTYLSWREAGVGVRTIRMAHGHLTSALDYGVRMRLVPYNVCRSVKPPRYRAERKEVWSAQDLDAFLDAAADDSLAPLWHILALTGIRRGEGMALRWADVDVSTGQVTIRQGVVIGPTGAALVQDATKTDRSRRSVKMPPSLIERLHTYRLAWVERKLAAGHDSDLLFPSADGGPVHPTTVGRRFRDLCLVAGVPYITVHGLRHTHASLLFAAGVPMKVVSDRLGHSSMAITADIYTHLTTDNQDEAAQMVDDVLSAVRKV